MKNFIWLIGDVIVPNVGKAEIGKKGKAEKSIVDSLIAQGMATDNRISKREQKIIDGGKE